MSYIRKATFDLVASTAAATNTFSTIINGFIKQISFTRSTSVPWSTTKKITVGRGTSSDEIFKFFPSSSTETQKFQPTRPLHGSSGNVLSSTVLRTFEMMADERAKISIPAATSSLKTSGVLKIYWG